MRSRPTRLAAALLGLGLGLAGCSEPPDDDARPQAAVGEPASQHLEQEEVDRLRALGYVDVVEEEEDEETTDLGVLILDRARAQPGLTFFTNANDCASYLITLEGGEVRSWRHEPCELWGNSILLPSGEVLTLHRDPEEDGAKQAVGANRKLLKLGWSGEVLLEKPMPVHHDVDLMPDGGIATLTWRHQVIPEIHPSIPVRAHFVRELGPGGEDRRETSLMELLLDSRDILEIQPVEPKPKKRESVEEIDLLHANSLEWLREPELAARNPLYAPTNVLLCMRHQDLVMIVDWPARKILWAWGQGELSGPHDATLLPNGNILVFDNGLARKWSRIVEVNPLENRIVWEYRAPEPEDFFTMTRGAAQRLPNGNTLVTYSRRGIIFEVTPDGETVWLFKNARDEEGGARSAIVRARRIIEAPAADGTRFLRSD